MKLIGHRGAAGLALENTIASIQAARKAGVDAIEFDIRVTEDQQLVLNHDRHLGRVSGQSKHIRKQSLRKLRAIPLADGQTIATLTEAIKAVGSTPILIEGKENDWAQPLALYLQKQKHLPPLRVISFNHRELYTFSLLAPSVSTYALENTKPIEVIRTARLLGFSGIDINFWLLNPLTYYWARYYKLDIIVYTVNRPVLAQFLRLFYPSISVTTDVPNRLQFIRSRKKRNY